jgi:hypothetical protein
MQRMPSKPRCSWRDYRLPHSHRGVAQVPRCGSATMPQHCIHAVATGPSEGRDVTEVAFVQAAMHPANNNQPPTAPAPRHGVSAAALCRGPAPQSRGAGTASLLLATAPQCDGAALLRQCSTAQHRGAVPQHSTAVPCRVAVPPCRTEVLCLSRGFLRRSVAPLVQHCSGDRGSVLRYSAIHAIGYGQMCAELKYGSTVPTKGSYTRGVISICTLFGQCRRLSRRMRRPGNPIIAGLRWGSAVVAG